MPRFSSIVALSRRVALSGRSSGGRIMFSGAGWAFYSLSGFVVGALVGMTGVGGGSLMTPILILLFGFYPDDRGRHRPALRHRHQVGRHRRAPRQGRRRLAHRRAAGERQPARGIGRLAGAGLGRNAFAGKSRTSSPRFSESPCCSPRSPSCFGPASPIGRTAAGGVSARARRRSARSFSASSSARR